MPLNRERAYMLKQEFEMQYFRKGRIPTMEGWCNIRVYEHDGKTIVVASEVIESDGSYANEGASVINAVETVAQCIAERGIEFDVFFEHLPVRGDKWGTIDEDFSRVTFKTEMYHGQKTFVEADFKFIDRAGIEAIIGVPFAGGLTAFRGGRDRA